MRAPESLYVLSSKRTSVSDIAVAKFADFCGIGSQRLAVSAETTGLPERLPSGVPLAVHADTAQLLVERDWFRQAIENAPTCLVYGFRHGEGSDALAHLTSGAIHSVMRVQETRQQYTFDLPSGPEFPISGTSFTLSNAAEAHAFVCGPSDQRIQNYILLNGAPCFVSLRRGGCQIFLLASESLPDLDSPLVPDVDLRSSYYPVLALTIFNRLTFGSRCWHRTDTAATLIIDDPYLKRRYGFIEYGLLLANLQESGCSTTIAFIPYNYRRTDPEIAQLVAQQREHFSICVHGCDHTSAEFASADAKTLHAKLDCALDRMSEHEKVTGVSCEPVMVFPQGRFSTTAVAELKSAGYLAGVNSTLWPVDWQAQPLTIRDLLDVAVTRYDSFPIFGRRYPRDIFDFAFDAFLNKPVLVVEHHHFFKNGYAGLSALAAQLRAVIPNIVWRPLQQNLTSSAIVRSTGPQQAELRFFTPDLVFRNPSNEPCDLSVVKAETGEVNSVLAGNDPISFEVRDGKLHFEAQLAPNETLSVSVRYQRPIPTPYKPSLIYRAQAATRRALRDFADNRLCRNEAAMAVVSKARKMFSTDSETY